MMPRWIRIYDPEDFEEGEAILGSRASCRRLVYSPRRRQSMRF